MKTSLFLMLLLSNVCLADYMGDSSVVKGVGKYKIGDKVLINLKDTKHNGKCDGLGVIDNYMAHNNTYLVGDVTCRWGNQDGWFVDEGDILEVIKEEDFGFHGKYNEGRSNGYLPCVKNNFSDKKKKQLCKENPYKFY